MDPYVGEIRLVPFNFTPQGWQACDGSLLSISEFEVLFVLLGTTYGGDGINTFAVPDLRGRAALHMGSNYLQGAMSGSETATITLESMPQHSHALQVSGSVGSKPTPDGNFAAVAPNGLGFVYGTVPAVQLNPLAVGASGSGQAHSNMQPYLALNYIISLFGIFPSQN